MIGILGGMGTQAGLDFCNKLAVLNRRKGERYKSSTVKYVGDIKIWPLKCKYKIRDYIQNYINNN